MSEYVVVKVDEKTNGEDLALALKEFKGVESVELDGDCASDMLREVGAALWKLENHHRIDCPLNELRMRIETLLQEDTSVGYKDMDSMLGEVRDYQI